MQSSPKSESLLSERFSSSYGDGSKQRNLIISNHRAYARMGITNEHLTVLTDAILDTELMVVVSTQSAVELCEYVSLAFF